MIRRLIILLLIVGCDLLQEEDVYGCTVEDACNFNADATIFDDSCITPIAGECPEPSFGCTDNQATNYDVEATDDDGSCIYGTAHIEYADEHWDFGRWIHDYYKWYEYKDGDDDWNAIREIFINSIDTTTGCSQDPTMGQCYIDIWDYSHRIKFTYDGSIMSSNSDEFKQVFKDLCGNPNILYKECLNEVVSLYDNNNDAISAIKDHHFYEGIGKYNMFTAGWDDTDSIYVITNDDGSKTAMTPHKLHYQESQF